MSNKKRVFKDTFDDNDELQRALDFPPPKKGKICPTISEIESICKIIDQSSLTCHLCVPSIITNKIAEYARGEVKYCSNKQCNQRICIFKKGNANTSEFKTCVPGSTIWCVDCMEFTIPSGKMSTHPNIPHDWSQWCRLHNSHGGYRCCHRLEFIGPGCSNCYVCHQPLTKHCKCLCCEDDRRNNGRIRKCCNCDAEICYKCRQSESTKCASCQRNVCPQCKASLSQLDLFVCTGCYDHRFRGNSNMLNCNGSQTLFLNKY
eukprot:193749_1